jgi:hypothetical protein
MEMEIFFPYLVGWLKEARNNAFILICSLELLIGSSGCEDIPPIDMAPKM